MVDQNLFSHNSNSDWKLERIMFNRSNNILDMLHRCVLIQCRVWRCHLIIHFKVKIWNDNSKLFQTTVILYGTVMAVFVSVYGVLHLLFKRTNSQTCLLINEDLFKSDLFLCLELCKNICINHCISP